MQVADDPELLWLWHRPVTTAPIRPLAWEPPCATEAAREMAKKKKKKVISDVLNILNILNITELFLNHLKIIKMVNFMLYVYHQETPPLHIFCRHDFNDYKHIQVTSRSCNSSKTFFPDVMIYICDYMLGFSYWVIFQRCWFFLFFFCLFVCFCFLGPHLRHMEIPRLGVELKLQLPSLHHSHSNTGSKPYLQPTPQLMATLDPYPTE